ncbi:MAG TPA: DUF721 domain-containing protein [Desulfomonilia bacterium]|nr:DUF721 domain-containing protein [Desulfomonilia bacterium]
MQRVGDILAKNNEQIGQILKLRRNWKKIAGEMLAEHTEPVVIRNKTLHIMCDSPAWAQQVCMMSKVFEKQIKEIIGIRVNKVEGKFGVSTMAPMKEKAAHPIARPDIDPDDVKKLKDPVLAQAVRSLINTPGDNGG